MDELTKSQIIIFIKSANKKFKTDFELIGSWEEKGVSRNDIDVKTDLQGKVIVDSAIQIAKKTNMAVDIWPSWAPLKGLYKNYLVFPDGKRGWSHDIAIDELISDGIIERN